MSPFVICASDLRMVLGNTACVCIHQLFEKVWHRYHPFVQISNHHQQVKHNTINNNTVPSTQPPPTPYSHWLERRLAKTRRQTFKIRTQDRLLAHLVKMKHRHEQNARYNDEETNTRFRQEWGIKLERLVFCWYSHLRTRLDHSAIQDVYLDPLCYRKQIGTVGNDEIWLYGKLDGKQIDRQGEVSVLEIKSRMSASHPSWFDHEYVQLQAYMQLTGLKKGFLIDSFVQSPPGQHHTGVIDLELNVLEAERDSNLWTYFIMPRLKGLLLFMQFLDRQAYAAHCYWLLNAEQKDTYLNFVLNHVLLPLPPLPRILRDSILNTPQWQAPPYWNVQTYNLNHHAPEADDVVIRRPIKRGRYQHKPMYEFQDELLKQCTNNILSLPIVTRV